MSGSHYAQEPARDASYDCCTLPEQERDDVAALRADVAALKHAVAHQADVIQVLVLRVEDLEREREGI